MESAAKPPLAAQSGLMEQALYEVRKKIYPRAVHGAFALWRWMFVLLTQLVFYGGPWVTWNDRQAVLFDLAQRKFYIFGLVFWPQDIVYLTMPCSSPCLILRSWPHSASLSVAVASPFIRSAFSLSG